MDIQKFREIAINSESRSRHIHTVWLCLNFVEEFPELAPLIGCLWNSDSTFLMNTSIYSLFINRKQNAVRVGFRHHNFNAHWATKQIRLAVPLKFNFSHMPSQLNWTQYKLSGFTKNTTEEEARNWNFPLRRHNRTRAITAGQPANVNANE